MREKKTKKAKKNTTHAYVENVGSGKVDGRCDVTLRLGDREVRDGVDRSRHVVGVSVAVQIPQRIRRLTKSANQARPTLNKSTDQVQTNVSFLTAQ